MVGDPSASTNAHAWNRQAHLALPGDVPMVPGRVEWTQYPGHGPGTELFGDLDGVTVAELGCGSGDNLAPLAAAGARCIGVDIAAAQLRRAAIRWGHQSIRFEHAEIRTWLIADRTPLDVCFSIFGAIGLCPTGELLSLLARRLRPGARLLFSVPEPRWLGDRADSMLLRDGTRVPVARWVTDARGWRRAIETAGFGDVAVEEIWTPDVSRPCTLLVTATRQ